MHPDRSVPAILYASLESIAFEYNQNRGWGPVVSQLPFLALLVGCLVAAGGNIYNNIYYGKRLAANRFKPVPEARLPPMMYGGFAFSGGLFLFGCKLAPLVSWGTVETNKPLLGTSSAHVSSPWPSIAGVFFVGVGFTAIFQSSLQYLVDTFTRYSPSAIATNTLVRSLAAGAFPLFVWPMYREIGIDWGSTIFGLVSVLLLPAPFLFFKWGPRIRARGVLSKLSAS